MSGVAKSSAAAEESGDGALVPCAIAAAMTACAAASVSAALGALAGVGAFWALTSVDVGAEVAAAISALLAMLSPGLAAVLLTAAGGGAMAFTAAGMLGGGSAGAAPSAGGAVASDRMLGAWGIVGPAPSKVPTAGAVARAAASAVAAAAVAAADSAAAPATAGLEACAPGCCAPFAGGAPFAGCGSLAGGAPFDGSPAVAAEPEAGAGLAAAPAACEDMAGAELPDWTVGELVLAGGGGRLSGCELPDAGNALPLGAELCCLTAGCLLRAVLPPASLKAPAKSWPLLEAA
jgi:hypothetical protein